MVILSVMRTNDMFHTLVSCSNIFKHFKTAFITNEAASSVRKKKDGKK